MPECTPSQDAYGNIIELAEKCGSLPNTGAEPFALALAGIAIIGTGVALRKMGNRMLSAERARPADPFGH